ncbi:MAG: DUF4055 domain-containing protein [Planctomycetes bacterium]|nr:DUF4055 domain-containing protein [Planctomycetota bacterium]
MVHLLNFEKTPQREDDVDSKSVNWWKMHNRFAWELIEDLLSGTLGMRSRRQQWLPKNDKETVKSYLGRIERSFLLEAFGDSIEDLAARPFSRPIVVEGADEQLEKLIANVDMTGSNLTTFGQDVFRAGITWGLTHILVDFPETTGIETLFQERAIGARPDFVHIRPQQLLSWTEDENQELTSIKFQESRTVRTDSKFLDEEIQLIRHYTQTEINIYQFNPDKSEWFLLTQEPLVNTLGRIPLSTFYTKRVGNRMGMPPLLALAWKNLEHWVSSSDQNNLLHFARVPILVASGLSQVDMKGTIPIGGNRIIKFQSDTAKLGFVEHSGKAIGAGKAALDDLKGEMAELGAEPLMEQPVPITATEAGINAGRSQAPIQAWVNDLDNTFDEAFGFAKAWTGEELPEDFKTKIFNEFNLGTKANEDAERVMDLRKNRDISHETTINEHKRRGILGENITAEDEKQKLEDEGPDLGMLTDIPPEVDDDNDEDED